MLLGGCVCGGSLAGAGWAGQSCSLHGDSLCCPRLLLARSCWSGLLFPAHPPELEENSSSIPLGSLQRGGIPPSAISSTGAEHSHKPTQTLPKEIQGFVPLCKVQGEGAVPAEHSGRD